VNAEANTTDAATSASAAHTSTEDAVGNATAANVSMLKLLPQMLTPMQKMQQAVLQSSVNTNNHQCCSQC